VETDPDLQIAPLLHNIPAPKVKSNNMAALPVEVKCQSSIEMIA